MKTFLPTLALAIMLSACASIDYIGVAHEPTRDVDVFFSEQDVERDYKVIGHLIATANVDESFYSNDKFMKNIIKKAQEKGADGVVILGFDIVATGSNTNVHVSTGEDDDGDIVTTEHSSTSVDEKRRVTALAIKYKSLARNQ